MARIDLTPFGFTVTESLVYQVLLTGGPGTGYAIARSAGLARANAYAALEGLVPKGGARSEGGRPKRYRPEPPDALLARVADAQGTALQRLGADLEGLAAPASPTLIELTSARAALQTIGRDVARAAASVLLVAPVDAYPLLGPSLRRPVSAGAEVRLFAPGAVSLGFVEVADTGAVEGWPGQPLVAVVDDRAAVIAARRGSEIAGHWSAAPTFVAAARMAVERIAGTA